MTVSIERVEQWLRLQSETENLEFKEAKSQFDAHKLIRMRACYQHCCLMFVSNQRMSNQSFRERLGLDEGRWRLCRR